MAQTNNEALEISKVKVEGLFFEDNNFEINFDKNISIIVAGNGFGKTTTLRMIEAFLKKKLYFFTEIIFYRFIVTFSNNKCIVVKKVIDKNSANVQLKISQSNIKEDIVRFEKKKKDEKGLWFLGRNNDDEFEIVEIFPQWYENLKFQPVLLIETNRLLLKRSETNSRHSEKLVLAVKQYSDDMIKILTDARSDYFNFSDYVDDKMIVNLFQLIVNSGNQKKINSSQVLEVIQEFEDKRNEFNKYGLQFDDKNDDDKLTKAIAGMKSKSGTQFYLFLYRFFSARLEKLNYYSDFLAKLKAFQDIINLKFNANESYPETKYTGKKFSINKSDGFKIESERDNRVIPVEKLSSGEQQEIVMAFQLLFKFKNNQLVLIDEPEISLHVVWQRSFINDLKKIADLTGVKFLVATHSPDIIDSNWEFVQELPYETN